MLLSHIKYIKVVQNWKHICFKLYDMCIMYICHKTLLNMKKDNFYFICKLKYYLHF